MSNLVPFSNYVEVNPARYIPDGLNLTSKVSFVPMADTSESGHWFGNQVRRLNEVLSGFTNFKNNDVLVAKITPCFENGKGAFVADLENGVGFGSTEFHVLRAKQGTCARFIFHVTQWPQFRLSSERFMTGSAGQKRVQTLAFSQFEIADFGEDEQKNIATILDTLDTQIRQTEAIIAKLQQVKQGLLHDLLTRGIDENGQLRPPYEQAPELYKDSPLGWIPKEWALVALNDIAEVDRGKFTHRPRNDPRFYGGRHPFIQTGDVAASGGDVLTSFSQSLSDIGTGVSKEFPEGTIAVTIAANIADTCILGRPMYFPDSIVAVVVGSGVSIRYVELVIRAAKRILDAKAPQSAQKNINLQDLRPLLVPLPNQEEQAWISERYESFMNRLNHEIDSVKKLKKQKAGLMDDLLTGRKRVTELIEQEKQAS
ncbi:restriction endonuclease subunit S [Vreelandella alkaliphila]|uniref:restriction endonuclease subunit S n=1 Tax=Vreelandella alkaliphila TaxID=272774 RepID=UPI003FD744FD